VKNQTIIPFSDRVEQLAAHLGIGVKETASRIGISPAMLFAYKSGKNPISGKAWRKLEEAEIRAGLKIGSDFLIKSDRGILVAEAKALSSGDPASRRECEEYFQRYLDAAGAAGDPNAFPFIMRLLKKHFPLSEWEKEDLKSQG